MDPLRSKDAVVMGVADDEERVPLSESPTPGAHTLKTAVPSYRLLQTLGLYAVMFGFGLIYALFGSCLVSLEGLYGVDTATISVALACLSGGLMAGDLLCGLVFDRLSSSIVMCLSCLVLGSSTLLAPWMPTVAGFSACICFQGLAAGFIDTSLGPYILSLWENHRAKKSIFQASYPIWSLGSFLSPLIVSPFLVDPPHSTSYHFTGISLGNSSGNSSDNSKEVTLLNDLNNQTRAVFVMDFERMNPPPQEVNFSIDGTVIDLASSVISTPITEVHSNMNVTDVSYEFVRYPYALVCSFAILTSCLFLVIFILVGLPIIKPSKSNINCGKSKNYDKISTRKDRMQKTHEQDGLKNDLYGRCPEKDGGLCKTNSSTNLEIVSTSSNSSGTSSTNATRCTISQTARYSFLALLFLFYYVYQHVEAVIGAYLALFVVREMGQTVQFGATMVAVLYGSQAAGRLLGVPVAYFVTPRAAVWVNLTFLCAAHSLMIFGPLYGNAVLITSVLMSGLFQATIYGSVMLYVSDYIPLTGFASAVCQLGSSTGKLVAFTFAAYMFEHYSHMWLLYILLGSSVILLLIFACMNVFVCCVKPPETLTVTLSVEVDSKEKSLVVP